MALARPHLRDLLLVSTLTFGASAATLAIPWLTGTLAARLIETGTAGTVRLVCALVIAILGSTVLTAIVRIVSGDAAGRILADLRMRLHAHLQRLPMSWHLMHRQGDALALMTTEVAHLGHFLAGTLIGMPSLLFTSAGAALLMLRIDPALALLAPVLIPLYFVLLKLVGRRLRLLGEREQAAEARIIALAEENLGAISAIKSFTREEAEDSRYRRHVDLARRISARLNRLEALVEPASTMMAALAALALLLLVGNHLHEGRLSSQELFSFLLYAALLTRPLAALAETWGQIQVTRGTLARMAQVLATPAEPGRSCQRRLPASRGAIRFEGIGFGYAGRAPILRDFNLAIAAGEKVAILGENGAGKSTLAALLLRFHECRTGRITLDGHDIADIHVEDLRRQIALVPQRTELLGRTIRENIAFGCPDASQSEIEDAALRADALDFIGMLPQGLDTSIGDRGVRLSGGQAQRIALARALLKDAPIVILDEATSMYDPKGEQRFVETCTRVLRDKTVIIITHRPASVALADRVVRLPPQSA